MATRTISTKVAITGESDYRASVARINSELKKLQSELKLSEAQYKNNANSMEALKSKGSALDALYKEQEEKLSAIRKGLENAREAESKWVALKEELNDKIEANNQALEELKNTTGDTSEKQRELTAENKKLNSELDTVKGKIIAAGKGITNWEKDLNNASSALIGLSADIELNNEYLREAEKSANNCATSIDRFGKDAKSSAGIIHDAFITAGIVEALKETVSALKECTAESIEFESAIAGVAKTTDMTGAELSAMSEDIQDLSTKIPATADEIANVAEAAGQLGIAKNDLLNFSEVMINLGVSTNLSSTEAASALAKFANVVNMSADDYERLGSVIVGLGNSFATTEADIVSMATRLASTGSTIGLTEPEIMAIATALSSVGIEAEAGGSAISKLLKKIETMVQTGDPALSEFAGIAEMTADEFSASWGENAVGALSKFIDGLGNIDRAGGSSIVVLNELGLTETRLSNAISALASSNGILEKALNTANSEWEENTALAKEATTRYETTESKLQLLSNAADNAKTAIGDDLTPVIRELADAGANTLNWCADFIEQNELIVPLLTSTAVALGTLAAGVTIYTAYTKLATAVTTAFTTAMSAHPYILAATALVGFTASIAAFITTTVDDGIPSVKKLTSAVDELSTTMAESAATHDDTITATQAAADVAEVYVSKLEELEATGLKTAAQQREYHNTLVLLCETVPELSNCIDTNNDTIDGGTAALRKNIEEWKNLAIVQAYQDEITEILKQQAKVEVEAAANTQRRNAAVAEAKTITDNYKLALKQKNDMEREAAKAAEEYARETGNAVDYSHMLTKEYYDLVDAISDYEIELQLTQKEIDRYNKAVEKDNEAVANATEQTDVYSEALNELLKKYGLSTKAAEENADAIESVESQLNDLSSAYDEAYEAAYESIDKQIGLFDTFAESVSDNTYTAEGLLKSWSKTTENLAQYTENLQKAAEYGITDGLVRALSDGSEESVGYLASIIEHIEELETTTEGVDTDAKDFVDSINAAYSDRSTALGDFSKAVASLETEFSSAITEIENTLDSVVNDGTVNNVGRSFVSGIESGVKEQGPSLIKAIEDTGTDVEGAATEAATATVENFSDEYEKISAKTKNIMRSLRNVIAREGLTLSSSAYAVGQQMVNGMINGMRNRSGSLYSTISSIVNKAIEKAQKAADTASPSKKTTKIFEDVGEGMIVGLENKRQRITANTQSVVDEALSIDTSKLIETARSAIDDRFPVFNLKENTSAQQTFTNAVVQALTKKASDTGNVYVQITSPEALDEKKAAREFKKAQRDLSLGII